MFEIDVMDEGGFADGARLRFGEADEGDTVAELALGDRGTNQEVTVLLNRATAVELMAQLGIYVADA